MAISAESVLSVAVAFIPVLSFLGALQLMDSYKLVPPHRILSSVAAGAAAAGVSYLINTAGFELFRHHPNAYASVGAPFVEELSKSFWWIFLIATARVAFMVDAAICAFAVGAGFALVENVFYLNLLAGNGVGVFILRGLGTAMMHGGVAAIAAMLCILASERRGWRGVRLFAPGLLAAIAIHSLFNLGLVPPVASTVITLVALPVLLTVVFLWSESSLQQWLGDKLDQDIELLNMIATGQLNQTRSGAYLQSLQDAFPPEIRGDMLCMLQLTLELSARAKGDLMLREAGFPVAPDPEIDAHFEELKYLQKSVGRTGLLAIAPLLSQTPRDLWEMHRLSSGR
jgi:RsiW-degrading membrane proteinase PrsW (M82 family)